MMLLTGTWLCFLFLFLSFMLHLSPTLSYTLNDCTIVHSENVTAGVSVDCQGHIDRFEPGQLVSVPEDIPRDTISLTLQYNQIKKINRDDFSHLSNLRELNLRLNDITHVDNGAFVHLSELKILNMDYNVLTTLPDKMFQGLSNLLVLSLDVNDITSISPAAFQFVPRLQELSLKSNKMTDIITILQLPRLQVLNITIDELVSFQSKDMPLNMTSELRELSVYSGSIKRFSITTAVFPHLEMIDLTLCCGKGWEWDIPDKFLLRNITKVSFGGQYMSFNNIRKSLQSLDSLEHLQLTHMDKWMNRDLFNIACNISTLRTLSLFRNHIESLGEILTQCTELTNLDLSLNDLTELSIKQIKKLSHLNLEHNKLSKVPGDIKHLSVLEILNLRHNNIQDLTCLDFLNLTRLTHLHLDDNHISELKQCFFQHLNDLKVLTVNNNLIVSYNNMFKTGLQKLEFLDSNNNVIRDFDAGELTNLKSLKHLDAEMFLKTYYYSFGGLDKLETLSLTYNYYEKMTSSPPLDVSSTPLDVSLLKSLRNFTIQFIPETIEPYLDIYPMNKMLTQMTLLEHLTIDNVYSTLPDNDTFNNVPQLKTLALRSNIIPYLYPEMFYPIPELEVLDLSNNKLKSLDFLAQANLTRLVWLDLSQNQLTVINVSVFSFLPALRYVYMADNPFTCDCSNSDFLQWILYNKQQMLVFAHSYTCAYPLAKKGTRFLDFDYHSCEQMDTSFICYISNTCVIVLILLTSFTYHFLRLHLLYAYYLFLAFLYDAKERKRGSPQRYDAFISYNVHDELWVYREMLPVLEGEQGWRLCLHHRDFLPGTPIIENITDAIYSSRKTICVISRHYLESEWCSREFQMASYRLFDEQKDVMILVFLEDIPVQQLSPHYQMRRLMKSHTYLSWTQAGQHPGLFWQNLRRALDAPDTDPDLNQ